jgi:hypothetical protein
VTEIPLRLLPRLCPVCGERTIIGHGQRLKLAHDRRHQQIWIRRGRCRPCHKTFTVLPDWSLRIPAKEIALSNSDVDQD